jgi:glycosyltransferase involved in cell wall biosynthesis
MRLGLYIDAFYRTADDQAFTNFETLPFLTFGCEVGAHFDVLVVFGRNARAGDAADHPLPGVSSVVPLPWYPNLAAIPQVLAASIRTVGALWRGLTQVDVVWVFGPHPYGLVLAMLGLLRRRRVVLGVRQDTRAYFRSRLRRPAAAPVLVVVWALDLAWRLLSRVTPTTVVGAELERRYGGPRPGLITMTISLVRTRDVVEPPVPSSLGREIELLTVGRIEPEKNPKLLVDSLARLVADGGERRWRLVWVGTGAMAEAVRAQAEQLGISGALDLRGFVEPGDGLLAHYLGADVFVHVAVTEGVPQVLLEAAATATPIVATAVGGVASALDHGAAGLLVPPHDEDALVAALTEVVEDDAGRERRVARALALAREHALEVEAARVAAWLRQATGRGCTAASPAHHDMASRDPGHRAATSFWRIPRVRRSAGSARSHNR